MPKCRRALKAVVAIETAVSEIDLFVFLKWRFSSQWFWCSCVHCRMWLLLRTQACFEVQTTSLSRFQTLLRSCDCRSPLPRAIFSCMQQGIWILNTMSSSSVFQLRSPWTLLSLFSVAVVRKKQWVQC